MKKLIIKQINHYNYILTDNKKDYEKNIDFLDLKLKVGDILCLPNNVLEEVNNFTFGPYIKNTKINDTIIVIHNGEKNILSRYYG